MGGCVDGKPIEIGRVDYLLRAINIPAGEHTVEMTFRPASVTSTVAVARVAVTIIYILLGMALAASLMRRPAKED